MKMVIGQALEDIEVTAFDPVSYEKKTIKLSDYRGKWLVVVFYPADFTFVCPTELADLAKLHSTLKEMGADTFTVSTDTHFVHKAWKESESLLKNVSFPMVGDTLGKLAKQFGVYDENSGLALRGTFIIDPEGVVKSMDVNLYDVGRNLNETVRRLKAFQYVEEHPGVQCPARWDEGKKAVPTTYENVGKVGRYLRRRK
jgi:peroxiredoxin (alkyl hydroperoxide reductase subunit C)